MLLFLIAVVANAVVVNGVSYYLKTNYRNFNISSEKSYMTCYVRRTCVTDNWLFVTDTYYYVWLLYDGHDIL